MKQDEKNALMGKLIHSVALQSKRLEEVWQDDGAVSIQYLSRIEADLEQIVRLTFKRTEG